MALFDRFKKYYTITCRCYNCGFSQECKIPKGNTIDSWLATPEALCENCGNPTLRRIERVSAPQEVQKPTKQQVKYPVKEPVSDEKSDSPKLKNIDFWTGKEMEEDER